jgi:transcription elongation factor Elf1
MGDKDKDRFKKKGLMLDLEKVDDELKSVQRRRKEILVRCNHQNANKKLKLIPLNDRGDFKCKICHQTFNMNLIEKSNLLNAVQVIHNAIQQIRALNEIDEDKKILKYLGEMDFNIQELSELYDRIVAVYGKNKKKKRRDDDDIGSYGVGALEFIKSHKK